MTHDDNARERTGGIGRRTYLKMVGAGAAVAAAGTGTAAAESYTTVTVGSGETRTYNVGSGEVFSNYLFDVTASGANVQIIANGSNWEVRDIGFKGVIDEGTDFPRKHIVPTVDAGSTGIIENVYMGDGSNDGRQGAIWVNDEHAGELIIRNCNVQGWADNGIYGSGPGTPSQAQGMGSVKIENCYAKNNNVSNFRIGTPGSYVRDSVVHVDADVQAVPGGENARGIWGWYVDDLEVTRTDILIEHPDGTYAILANHDGEITYSDSDYAGGSLSGTVHTNNVGNNPDVTPPDGVPMTAEEAASDTSSGGGGGDATQVAEDFSHDDVPGTYSFDTGAFTTTTTRSTTDSYALQPAASSNGGRLILRDDMETTAGETYELDVYFTAGADQDMGFAFGAQPGVSGWSDYTGYLGFFHSNGDQIRVDYLENGSLQSSPSTAATWPLDEWLTVELDYRDTDSSTITMTVSDSSGAEIASVSLADTTYDAGSIGWYSYHAAADWSADSWFNASGSGSTATAEAHKFGFDNTWRTQSLTNSFADPVVVAKPISYAGGEPAHTRLSSVSAGSFDSKVEEWDYLGGGHVTETVSSLTLETGAQTTDDGAPMEVGTVTTTDSLNWTPVSFSQSFASAPVVLSQVQTFNGADSVVTRNRNVSTGGFDTAMQEQENLGPHGQETVGYLAIAPGTGTLGGASYEAKTVTGVGDIWTTVNFDQSYTDPVFLADMQTIAGNNPTGLRYRNLTGSSVELLAEEEQSADTETTHNGETVGVLVVENN